MEMLRYLRTEDADQILELYAPFIAGTAITFEEEVPSREAFLDRICRIAARYPFLVAMDGSRLAGYAYAALHRERAAYRWITETSVYIAADQRGKGLGKLLYGRLLEELTKRNFTTAYGIITLPNEGSVALHRACGFSELVVHRNAGWKLQAWHDVLWMKRSLNACTVPPDEPVFKNCLDTE